jgi:hypothetical protein
METRDLLYDLTTVQHPDHPDKIATAVLVYFKTAEGKPIDVGTIERRDPVGFTVRPGGDLLLITIPDLARILNLAMHLDEVIADLRKRARDRLGQKIIHPAPNRLSDYRSN